jgi:hypothetical protein
MSKFLCQLDMRLMWDVKGFPLCNRDGRQLYQLLHDFSYLSDVAKGTITAPAGFVTDLASVPRLPFMFLALGDMGQEPGVIHDYLYSTGVLPRSMADSVLREALEVTGVSRVKANMFYAGVRVGGASHYGTT